MYSFDDSVLELIITSNPRGHVIYMFSHIFVTLIYLTATTVVADCYKRDEDRLRNKWSFML
jgi:hypothetical protein